MGIKFIIAVTDDEWFEMLRQQQNLKEVNFWSPTPQNFRALQRGELFLFKLPAPRNMIVGGGIFDHASTQPFSLAWEAFRESNGARSKQEMRALIAKHLKINPSARSEFEIGCRILTQPFFFKESDWIPAPSSWARNIVSFKTYSTDNAEGLELWNTVDNHRNRIGVSGMNEDPVRFGEPQLFKSRLGQGGFRTLVTDIYRRRCAVTQERTLPALDAAHIRPYSKDGKHEASNGLLLRRDIHSLFDSGYVTVTPDLNFEVSGRIKEEFENGRDYYALHGNSVSVPEKPEERPSLAALTWHNENCFRE